MKYNRFERLKGEIANKIDGMIIYYYGERNWHKLPKKKRHQIIEDVIRDTAPLYATKEEINKIIKIEQSKEA